MDRNGKILILALAVPLLLYGVPYAYATTTSSSYVIGIHPNVPANTILDGPEVFCNPGDYATGVSFGVARGETVLGMQPLSATGPIITTGIPVGFHFTVFNSDSQDHGVDLYVVCQTPITVAGITVPEFGSLYGAIVLAAVAYFGLSLLRSRRISTTAVPK
jgi:hypothetical protein